MRQSFTFYYRKPSSDVLLVGWNRIFACDKWTCLCQMKPEFFRRAAVTGSGYTEEAKRLAVLMGAVEVTGTVLDEARRTARCVLRALRSRKLTEKEPNWRFLTTVRVRTEVADMFLSPFPETVSEAVSALEKARPNEWKQTDDIATELLAWMLLDVMRTDGFFVLDAAYPVAYEMLTQLSQHRGGKPCYQSSVTKLR